MPIKELNKAIKYQNNVIIKQQIMSFLIFVVTSLQLSRNCLLYLSIKLNMFLIVKKCNLLSRLHNTLWYK